MRLKKTLTLFLVFLSIFGNMNMHAEEKIKLSLVPVPKKVEATGVWEPVNGLTIEVPGTLGEISTFAKQNLQELWNKKSKVSPQGKKLQVVMWIPGKYPQLNKLLSESNLTAKSKIIQPEGYILKRFDLQGNPRVLIIAADERGILYGSQTFFDVLNQKGVNTQLPQELYIEDAPELKIRMLSFRDNPASIKAALMGRMNLTMVGPVVYGKKNRLKTYLPGSKETKILTKYLSKANPRGIDVYPVISMHAMEKELNHRFSLSNPEDKVLLAEIISRTAKLKANGFSLCFDDIKPDFPTEKDKQKYKNIGELQLDIIKFLQAEAAKFGIDKIIVCPTLYRNNDIYGMHGDPVEYYKYFMKAENVDFFHCAYRKKDIDKLKSFGFRNWIWWYNGPFSIFGEGGYSSKARPKGCWEGFRDLYWGWYNTYLHPQRGLCIYPDTVSELKKVQTDSGAIGGFMSGGEAIERYRNLLFLWSPSRFNEENADRAMLEACFGRENIQDYLCWQSISRKWLLYFMGGAKLSGSENNVQQELSDDLKKAKQATENIGKRLAGLSVDFPKAATKAIKKMIATNKSLAARLDLMKTKHSKAHLTTERKIKWGIGPSAYYRYIRDMHFTGGDNTLYLQYVIAENSKKKFDVPFLFSGGGLCFLAPSSGNWGDLGFFGIRLGEAEIQNYKAEISKITLASGDEACRMKWKMKSGEVSVVVHLDKDGALAMDISATPLSPASELTMMFYCNPNAGRTAAHRTQGELKDWDRRILTNERNVKIAGKTPIELKKESWLVLYDNKYNAKFDFKQKPDFLNITGPAAFLYNNTDFAQAFVQPYGKYSIKGYFRLKHGVRNFKIKLYDLRLKNCEDIASYFKSIENSIK